MQPGGTMVREPSFFLAMLAAGGLLAGCDGGSASTTTTTTTSTGTEVTGAAGGAAGGAGGEAGGGGEAGAGGAPTVCGDGVLAKAEACDDGNTDSADGCGQDCQVELGYKCAGEPSDCVAVCGDG